MDRLPTIGSVPALVHALAETCVFVISLPAYRLVQHSLDRPLFLSRITVAIMIVSFLLFVPYSLEADSRNRLHVSISLPLFHYLSTPHCRS
jgi:hypothetical protein